MSYYLARSFKMKIIKIVIAAIVIILAAMLGLSVIGFVYSTLWYFAIIGILSIGGFTAYKFLKATKIPELEAKDPISQILYDDDIAAKQLEEYKQKLLK
jgi:hypothetical protein